MIDNLLKEIGLSNSEIKVYLYGKKYAEISSSDLIKGTKLPKPTVMAAIKELKDTGLCEYTKRDGRSNNYRMLEAKAASFYLSEKIHKTNELIEKINNYQEPKLDISTQTVVGQKEVQKLVEYALRCSSRRWQIISPKDNALAYMSSEYINYFKKVREDRQIVSQTLWAENDKKTNITLNDVIMRKPRYVPKEISENIPSLMIAFDDKLLAIEGREIPKAVMISNKSVVETFNVVFELAWRSQK
jgi:sugar-specific transcriptional regulator TrmB